MQMSHMMVYTYFISSKLANYPWSYTHTIAVSLRVVWGGDPCTGSHRCPTAVNGLEVLSFWTSVHWVQNHLTKECTSCQIPRDIHDHGVYEHTTLYVMCTCHACTVIFWESTNGCLAFMVKNRDWALTHRIHLYAQCYDRYGRMCDCTRKTCPMHTHVVRLCTHARMGLQTKSFHGARRRSGLKTRCSNNGS